MAKDRPTYSVKRIDDFNLSHRPFLSGIFGRNIDDVFIDSDLHRCDLREILFRSFKAQGYHVVFYVNDSKFNFYSYCEDDLAILFRLNPQGRHDPGHGAGQGTPEGFHYTAPVDSPFGHRRRRRASQASPATTANTAQAASPAASASTPGSHYDQIQYVTSRYNPAYTYYRIAHSADPFSVIAEFVRECPSVKMVVVFNNALVDNFDDAEKIVTKLNTIRQEYNTYRYQLKIVAIYGSDYNSIFDGGGLFCSEYFQDVIAGTTDKESTTKPRTVQAYNVPNPDKEEYRNLLNRRRLLHGCTCIFDNGGIDRLALALSQKMNDQKKDEKDHFDYERISDYDKLTDIAFTEKIMNENTGNARDRLNAMAGAERIIAQFDDMLEAYKEAKDNPKIRFRPHMAFMGAPGTGKTTVARLFADILREEGVLERGHLVTATVGDMVAEFVGQTRVKTQALCDRAKGGVLFVDEAYGLMSGKNSHGDTDFGAEAIEVLIQFMENNSDSLVILAGYKDEIENLLNNGNAGFQSRIQECGRFMFEDYPPDVLYQIFRKQFGDDEFTPEFETEIKMLISTLFGRRNFRWGNAREMENLANEVRRQHKLNHNRGAYTADDIPAGKKRLLAVDLDLDDILSEINRMRGLDDVKEKLTEILTQAMAERYKAMVMGVTDIKKKDLNFLFLGNPGTGKTTVANLLARILHNAGLIEKNEVKEIKIGDLVSAHVGGTAKNIDQLFRDHGGKVIFLDEAYELATQGREAITPLTSMLTDPRFKGTQALVLAGYTDDMNRMLSANVGLKSRFNYVLNFADYSNDDLVAILKDCLAAEKVPLHFSDPQLCEALADDWFENKRSTVSQREFGNARLCGDKGLANILAIKQGKRVMHTRSTDPETLQTVIPQDFPNYESYMERQRRPRRQQPHNNPQPHTPQPQAPQPQARSQSQAVAAGEKVSHPSHFEHAVGLVQGSTGAGTGFIISVAERLVLTASHVIENNDNLIFFMYRGTDSTPATVVWNDYSTDIALLRVDSLPDTAQWMELDTSPERIVVTTPIVHCGFLRGTEISTSFNTCTSTITAVEDLRQYGDREFVGYLSDINADHGCSGGPVMRADNYKVIGLLQGKSTAANAKMIIDIRQFIEAVDRINATAGQNININNQSRPQ